MCKVQVIYSPGLQGRPIKYCSRELKNGQRSSFVVLEMFCSDFIHWTDINLIFQKRWVQPSSTPGQTSGPTPSTSPAPSSSSSSSSRLCWVIRPCINNYQSDHFSDSTTNTLMVSPEPCITGGQFFNVLFQVKGWRKSYTHSNKARWLSWGILAKLNLINSHCEKSKLAGGALAPHSTNTL